MGRVVTSVATLLPGGTPPNTVTTHYVYDEAGNLITKVEGYGTALARTVNYEYDAASRLIEIDYPNDTDVTFSYDETDVTHGIGRLTRMTDASGTTRYSYDERGNITQDKRTIGETDYKIVYAYNLNNTIENITYRATAQTERSVNYTIDNATQRPVAAGSYCQDILYEPFGPIREMTLGNAQQVTMDYDQRYQIQDLDSGNVLDRTYTYDGMGNILSIDKHSIVHDLTPVYAYSYTDNYSYTKISGGNVLQADNAIETPARLHAYYSHNILGEVTVTKQYDIYEELVKEQHLTYNDDHRLTEVKDGADNTIATYTYNGLGQRIKKQVGSNTTIFLYDLQGNIISEMRDGSYDDCLYVEGTQRVAKITNIFGTEAIYYYHNDHLGTPLAMTNSSGTVVWKARYKTFGEAQVDASSTITNNFRLPGQYYDEETGLHYNYHRYYDPGTGRYVTSDPIGLEGGINLWAYAANNPMVFFDLEGLEVIIIGRVPPILRPGPWRLAPNQRCMPRLNPKPTPNPRLRPIFRPPPRIVKPQPKPWWYKLLRGLGAGDEIADSLKFGEDVVLDSSMTSCPEKMSYDPCNMGDPTKPYDPLFNPIGSL